jgi:hypothetical protein
MSKATVLLVIVPMVLAAQQASQPKSGEPIDFMTIVIEGKESLNLPKSLLKLSPQPPPPYTKRELDSINPLEKVPLFRSTPPEMPRQIAPRSRESAFISASAGLYGFATLSGHFHMPLSQYMLDLDGAIDRGGAYVANADYLRTNLRAQVQTAYQQRSDAPYTISRGVFAFDRRSYRLFALPTAPDRSLRTLALALAHESTFNVLPYSAQLVIQNTHLVHADTTRTDESELQGRMRVDVFKIDAVQFDATAQLSYRNYRGVPLHFHTINAGAEHRDSSRVLRAVIGAQVATTSWRATEYAPQLALEAHWRIDPAFWLEGSFFSGIEAVRFGELATECTFITDTAAIGVQTIPYRIKLGATYTPSETLALSITGTVNSYANAPFFESLSDATVAALYDAWQLRMLQMQARYTSSTSDQLGITIQLRDARFGDGSRVPYQPTVRATFEYSRVIAERLSALLQLGYVSVRVAKRSGNTLVNGFFLLGGRLEYQLSPSVALTMTLDNLFGSIYERWYQYRERGSFVGVGAVVRL